MDGLIRCDLIVHPPGDGLGVVSLHNTVQYSYSRAIRLVLSLSLSLSFFLSGSASLSPSFMLAIDWGLSESKRLSRHPPVRPPIGPPVPSMSNPIRQDFIFTYWTLRAGKWKAGKERGCVPQGAVGGLS